MESYGGGRDLPDLVKWERWDEMVDEMVDYMVSERMLDGRWDGKM